MDLSEYEIVDALKLMCKNRSVITTPALQHLSDIIVVVIKELLVHRARTNVSLAISTRFILARV